ncbi:MAG: DUF2127 domain-containing protein [Acidovorax sp.]|nr:DUF2127 domain-containing protein [Acidovorax sp.]
MQPRNAIRAVAAFEAFKGLAVLAAASGVLLLIHQDLHALAERLVAHTHLNPATKYPRIFIDAATHLQNAHLVQLALGAAAYALLRFVESHGLLHEAAWAEVLAAVSGAIYVPFEAAHLAHHPGWISAAALALNLAVVAIMVIALQQRRRACPHDNRQAPSNHKNQETPP